MDYKTLHGGPSLAASSRFMSGRNLAESARNLRDALPDEALEAVAGVEERLVEVAYGAPGGLVAPAFDALTAGGERLRPILLLFSAPVGEPGRGPPATAASGNPG